MEFIEKPVLFSEENYGPIGIGVITLNRPQAMNALNPLMYELIEPKLLEWEKAPHIGAVLIEGKGEKAFCAGGDVKKLVLDIKEKGLSAAENFFTKEYYVDCITQSYGKPIISFCHGVTMGGGIGLIAGSHFRIATESSVFAMPEIAIGLFPDVGATHFLSRLKDNFGLFLGLSGTRIRADDAVACGLMDFKVSEQNFRKIRVDLLRLPWKSERQANHKMLNDYFDQVSMDIQPHLYTKYKKLVGRRFLRRNLHEMDEEFSSLAKQDPDFQESYDRFLAGSAISRSVFHKAYFQHENLNMLEVLCREWDMALNFSAHGEFSEGVRAVLIDKDQKPNWHTSQIKDVSVVEFFKPKEKNLLRDKLRQSPRQILQWS